MKNWHDRIPGYTSLPENFSQYIHREMLCIDTAMLDETCCEAEQQVQLEKETIQSINKKGESATTQDSIQNIEKTDQANQQLIK